MKRFSTLINKIRKLDISVIWYTVIPLFALFLCLIFSTNYILSYSNKKLKSEIQTAHESTFRAISANVESLKYGIDSFAQQMSNDKLILSIGENYTWEAGDIYYDTYTLNTNLNRSLLPYDSVNSIGIYYPRSNNIVIDGGVLNAKNEFKNFNFPNHISGKNNYENWKDFITSPHFYEMHLNDSGDIFYLHSIKKSGTVIAVIILDINPAVFDKLFNSDPHDSGIVISNHLNEVIFSDESNIELTSALSSQSVSSKKMQTLNISGTPYMLFMNDNITQLSFSYYISESEFYKPIKEKTVFLYSLLIFIGCLAAFISFYFIKKHYRSISEVKSQFSEFSSDMDFDNESNNEYTYIKNSLKAVSTRLTRFDTTIKKQNMAMFLLSLNKHLTSFYNTIEISKLMEIHHISFNYGNYVAALVTINYADETYWYVHQGYSEQIFYSISNLLTDYSGDSYSNLLVQIDETTALILIGTDVKDKTTINSEIEKAFTEENSFCIEQLKFDFDTHISHIFSDINDLKSIYKKLSSTRPVNSESSVTFYATLSNNQLFNYELFESIENSLLKALEEQDFDSSKKILDELYGDTLSSSSVAELVYVNNRIMNVFSTLVKNLDSSEISGYINHLNELNPQKNCLESFISLAKSYCATATESNTTKKLSAAITDYVTANFSDPALNVNTIGYEFNRAASYISRLFKSETGKMLNQFISETRLHHAKKLLLSGKKVDDIATECGFSDITTFRRVFKRHLGVTPSEYRKSILDRNSDL